MLLPVKELLDGEALSTLRLLMEERVVGLVLGGVAERRSSDDLALVLRFRVHFAVPLREAPLVSLADELESTLGDDAVGLLLTRDEGSLILQDLSGAGVDGTVEVRKWLATDGTFDIPWTLSPSPISAPIASSSSVSTYCELSCSFVLVGT